MSPAAATQVALAVDGAETPEAVSDEMAYALFFRALAAPSPHHAARMDGVLASAGLAPADRAAVVAVLGPVTTSLETVARQRQALPAGDPTPRTLEREVIAAARDTVDRALSPAARTLLDAYVQTHVKRRVKIYRGPYATEVPQ